MNKEDLEKLKVGTTLTYFLYGENRGLYKIIDETPTLWKIGNLTDNDCLFKIKKSDGEIVGKMGFCSQNFEITTQEHKDYIKRINLIHKLKHNTDYRTLSLKKLEKILKIIKEEGL